MRLKRQRAELARLGARNVASGRDYLLVAAMQPVEITDGNHRIPRGIRKLADMSENLHGRDVRAAPTLIKR